MMPTRRLSPDAAGGVALMAAAALALVVANGPAAPVYHAALALRLGPLTIHHWIDEALMALFFLLVGLEMKRELVSGQLARPADRLLPALAAVGGMAVPGLVYLAIAGGTPGLARGWAIPAATDIAFATAVLALLGRDAVPRRLALFLTSVAIVDDMGAVAIIALFYTAAIQPWPLVAAAAVWAAMLWLGRRGVAASAPYVALAAALWLAVFASGVHATVAGVLAALAIPADGGAASPLHRLEHRLRPWVTFAVLPLFGFASAGVALAMPDAAVGPLVPAVALGLFLGKQAGVMVTVRLAVAAGLAQRPGDGWAQVHGVALLCGIGFTMSLFIGGLAFADPARMAAVKLGVLAGSIASAVAGYIMLRRSRRSRPA